MSQDIGGRARASAIGNMGGRRPSIRRGFAALASLLFALALYAAPALADRNFGVRYHTDDNGAIVLAGNTLLTCTQGAQAPPVNCPSSVPVSGTGTSLNDNNYNMVYVNTVGGTGVFNSSTANLARPNGATVLFAGLYWSGETNTATGGSAPPSPALKNQVLFSTPAAPAFRTITAQQLDTTTGIGGAGSGFNGFADVTSLVQAGGAGTYAVGNLQAATGQNRYGGWALIVVFRDATQPLRDMTVFDGYLQISTTTVSNVVRGFKTPASGAFTTTVGAVAFDGDLGSTGDAMRLNGVPMSDALNPATNFYNSTISYFGSNVTTRNPTFQNTLGVDIDVINTSGQIPNGATSASVDFVATSGDTYFPDVLTFSTDVFQPDFSSNGFTKTVTDLNGGSVLPGDVLEYVLTETNTGNDGATGVVLTDAIPANTTFVPGSLAVLSGANAGAKSDIGGDDQAEFNGAAVVFRLGTGANATSGGSVPARGSTSVRFRVRVNAATPANTTITNQGALHYLGATLGTPFDANSDGDPTVPGAQPTIVQTTVPATTTLSMTKTGAPDPVVPGQPLTYTIVVTNSGPSAAASTLVADSTPPNTTFASASAPAGWTVTSPAVGGTGAVQFSNASLPVGQYTLTLVVNVNAAAPAPGSISNTATISSPTDPDLPFSASTSNATTPAQNLSITKNGAGAVGQSQDIAYTIVVNNAGPASATNVVVSDPTPANTTLVSTSAPPGWTIGGPAAGGTGTVTFSNASLAPGQYVLTLTVHTATAIAVGSTLSNTATVASPSDTDPGDNTATASALVRNPVPTVNKAFAPASVLTNADSALSLVITNNAGIAISGVAVSDPLPANLVVSPTPGVVNTCGGTVAAAAGATTVALTGGAIPANGSCTVTVNVRSATAGTYVNTTGNVSSTQSGTGGTGTATLDVAALASAGVTKTFAPNPLGAGGTAVMTIGFTNPNAASITGVAFTDVYPSGLSNALTGTVVVANTCGGTLTAANGGTSATLTGGTVPTAGCNIQVNVTASFAGSYTNVTGPIVEGNAVDSPGASGTLVVTTLAAPIATKSFAPATVPIGGASQMTIALTNPNAVAITSASFTDAYPAGIVNGATPLASNTCAGVVDATAGAGSAALAGGTIPANGSCSIVVNVVGTVIGTQVNTTSTITSANAVAGSAASGTLTVAALTAPTTTKSFSPSTVSVGGASQMTIQVTNPNTQALTGVAFTDAYPAGLVNGTGLVSNTCGGTATAAAGATSTSLTGGTVGASSSCTIVVNVVATQPGAIVNTTGPVTSANGSAGTGGSGTLNVNASADLSVVKTGPASVGFGASISYSVVVANAGPSAGNGAAFADTVPAGITNVNATCASTSGGATCGGVNVAGNTVTSAIATLPANSSVTFTITGTAPTSGATIANTATVTPAGTATDPNTANNTSTWSTTLSPASLSLAKTATPTTFIVGQPARYDIAVTNGGPGVTTAPIIVGDALPTGITLTQASGANWSCTGTQNLSCTFSGTLASGASTTLSLDVTVGNTATDANNSAAANGGGDPGCPAALRCSSTVTVPVTQSADIVVGKSVDNATPNVGETITFTVTATNAGPSDATNVVVTDALPSGLSLASATPDAGTFDAATGRWTIPTLANGADATLTIVANVLMPGTLTNIATRTGGDQLDPDPSNNSAQASVNAQPTADLRISKTVDRTTPNLGTNVVFTITATNAGPDDATGVSVSDALPAGLSFVQATPSQGTYDAASGVWTVGNIAANADATLAITATVTLPGDITNTASVRTSDEFDPNVANNAGGVTINGQSADVQIVKTVDNANPVVGDTVTFTVAATNNGPSAATGIEVTDLLPAGLVIDADDESQGTYDRASGVWTLSSLDPAGAGSVATLTVTAHVTTDAGFTNTATVTAQDQPDPNPANDASSVVVTPIASADLSIVKTAPATVVAGETVDYQLAVTNHGPSDAANVVLDDPTPAGLTFVSADAPCTGGFPCDLGTIASGDVVNVTATFRLAANASGTVDNTASVSSDTQDPNPLDDTSIASSDVTLQSDITVTKTGPASVNAGAIITYTVVVANGGPSDADGTTFLDAVPAAIGQVGASCATTSGGAVCGAVDVAGNTVTSTIATLPASSSVTFTIFGFAPLEGGSLSNTASATPPAGTSDPNPGDDTSSVSTTVGARADLSVFKTGPASATPGQTVTYTIAVHNDGPSTASAVSLADPTPAGLAFVSATAPCAGGFPCALGDIASGADVSVSATYSIPANYAGASIANTATLSTPTADPDPSNNASTATTPTSAVADLSATKSGPSGVSAGSTIEYTVVVANGGPGDADGATFSDPVPVGITAVSATCGGATGGAVCGTVAVAGNVVTSTIATLPAGASVTFTIDGIAPSGTASLVNTASVAPPAGITDPTPGNDSSSVTTGVGAVADVSIVKSGPSSIASGAPIEYTLRIANAGPSAADGATYSDTLPGGITNVVARCGGETGGAACASPNVAGNVVSGAVPVLPAGGAATITIDGVAPIGSTSLANTATVAPPAGVVDPSAGNDTSTVTTSVGSAADIAVTKRVDNASPNTGDTVTFTITASNSGPNDATGVAVTDGLPFGLAYVSSTASQGSYDATTGLWTIGSLADGASATLTIVATVNAPGAIVNTATVSASDEVDPDLSNNASGAALNAGASADLAIAKRVDDATPDVGDTVTFTVTLSNNGPDDASGAEVTDALPGGLTLIAATASQGAYDASTGIWTVGNVANGANATLTIAATVDSADAIANIARISGENENDPAQGNNEAGAAVNGQLADVGLVKTVDNAAPDVGDTVTFTVTAHNNGPDAATDVVVTDDLPAGLTFVSATPSAGTYASGAWSIGTLDASGAGATATLSIVAIVSTDGAITNTASITASDQPDPNQTNDSASASLNGAPLADLSVVKTGPGDVVPGNELVYTIVVSNAGPSDATNVVVDDALPAGVIFGTNAGACTTPFPCTIASLASGASATITTTVLLSAHYDGPPSLVNVASVSSDTPDPDNTDNVGSAATAVDGGPASADLSIVKSGPASVVAGGTLTYTLAIANAGPASADGAAYTDQLPAGIVVTSATCGGETGGAACGSQPVVGASNITGIVATLPLDGAVVVTIVAIAPNADTTLTNAATIAPPAGVADPNLADNGSAVSTTVGTPPPDSADLSIVKSGPANASPGANVTYTLLVSNAGPATATHVAINDPTPAGLTFVSASAPCAGGFPCALGDLASGASAIVTVTFAIDAAATGSITNIATVSSDTPDPNGANNSGTAVTPLVAGATSADLVVTKEGPVSASAGSPVVYAISVVNNGPDAALNAVLTDPTPPGLTFVSATAPCAGGFPCALGTLEPGAGLLIDVTYIVSADAAGTTIVNMVAAGSDTPDPNGANNTSSVSTTVTGGGVASADIGVVKRGPTRVTVGGTVTYSLVVTNAGPDPAFDAMLDDPTPAGLTFESASAPCAGGFPCALGTLPSGTSTTISATYGVDAGAGTTIVNTATAVSSTFDPNPANSSSSASTTIVSGGGGGTPPEPLPVGGGWSALLIALMAFGAMLAMRGSLAQRR